MMWDDGELDREADAFAKRAIERYQKRLADAMRLGVNAIRNAQTPNPAEMADKVREQLEAVRQEQMREDGKYVHMKVMELLYDTFGHSVREVPEPTELRNSGYLPKDWA